VPPRPVAALLAYRALLSGALLAAFESRSVATRLAPRSLIAQYGFTVISG
jgi:hypothetical protein